MGGTSTVWFLVYHFTNHVGFQESGKLEYPEVPREHNSHIFMTLLLGFKSRPHWWKADKYFNHCHTPGNKRHDPNKINPHYNDCFFDVKLVTTARMYSRNDIKKTFTCSGL